MRNTLTLSLIISTLKLLLIPFLFLPFISQGQDDRYNDLLMIAKVGIVVSCYPMKIELNAWELKILKREKTDSILTDTLISQILEATTKSDTIKWESKEFKKTAVIYDRSEYLNANNLLNEWGVYDKAERKKYRRLINNFNPSSWIFQYLPTKT